MPLLIQYGATEIQDYLRIDGEESLVETFRRAAEDEAEGFLNTDFSTVTVNADGTETTNANEAPPAVKEWVLNRIAEKYEGRGQAPEPNFSNIRQYRIPSFRGFETRESNGIRRFN